jgi:hypothetical protein
MNATDYLALVTSEHAGKPLFAAVVLALTAPSAAQQDQVARMLADFDLDTAVGAQLDAVGEWVGIGRLLTTPLANVYFSWDGPATVGWDSGNWQGPFDPTTGLTSLPDDAYRTLIRAKIAANHWDGTITGAQAVWNQVFSGGQRIVLQDNQDMTMVVGFVGPPLSAVQQALLTGGYFPFKPEGVRIAYYAVPRADGPLFAWDADSPQLKGWDSGSWVQEIPSS